MFTDTVIALPVWVSFPIGHTIWQFIAASKQFIAASKVIKTTKSILVIPIIISISLLLFLGSFVHWYIRWSRLKTNVRRPAAAGRVPQRTEDRQVRTRRAYRIRIGVTGGVFVLLYIIQCFLVLSYPPCEPLALGLGYELVNVFVVFALYFYTNWYLWVGTAVSREVALLSAGQAQADTELVGLEPFGRR